MGLHHLIINLATLKTVSLDLGQSLDIGPQDKRDCVLLLLPKQIVQDDLLIDLLAVCIPANLHMLSHFFYYLLAFQLYQVDVLFLRSLILLSFEFSLDLIKGVARQVFEFFVDLLLHGVVVVLHLLVVILLTLWLLLFHNHITPL